MCFSAFLYLMDFELRGAAFVAEATVQNEGCAPLVRETQVQHSRRQGRKVWA